VTRDWVPGAEPLVAALREAVAEAERHRHPVLTRHAQPPGHGD
jgi:hypothetical protein